MKLVDLLLLGGFIYAIFRTGRSVERCRTPRERSVAIRLSAAYWLLALLYLWAMIMLPNKARLVLLLPGFFVAVSFARARRNSRERLAREKAAALDLEQMKRVGPTPPPKRK